MPVKLCVVSQKRIHNPVQRIVVLNAGVLHVRLPSCILIGAVLRHHGWNLLGDELVHTVGIGPVDIAELFVEGFDDVREQLDGKPLSDASVTLVSAYSCSPEKATMAR